MQRFGHRRRILLTTTLAAAVMAGVLGWAPSARGQLKPEQAADMLLTSARRAYNEKNYPFAIDKFREFLNKYGNHKEAVSARYGLALALLEGPNRDYAAAIVPLQAIAGNKDFADHAAVVYYLGLCQRGLGIRELAKSEAKPQEAAHWNQQARQRFDEAAKQFAAAVAAFTARAKEPPANAKQLPTDQEWVARARCDLAEMQLRTLKFKEAQATAEPFLKSPLLSRSKYHAQGLYYHGYASFLLKDYLTAGRSLNQLNPFSDPVFGNHARFLVARVHHITDERKEAAEHYEGVLADHVQQKLAAGQALQRPDTFKNDPEERQRLEALMRDPPSEHVARASFYVAVLHYEDGRFADSLARLEEFAKQAPKSPLLADVQLRQGFCRVQLKQFLEAIKTLQPLAEREPRLADQALFWIGKAHAGAADPNNPQAFDQSLKTALDFLRRAADRANQLAGTDPEAKQRRGEMLLELADTQQLARQHREAAGTYNQILNEKCLAGRDEEVTQRLATAWHLAGDFNESDKVCQRFQQSYPKSTLLPAVLFRSAENAYFAALAADKNPYRPTVLPPELTKQYDEAAKRYQAVLDKFPEFAYAHVARFGLALSYYRKGDLEKTRQVLETIPQPERVGALAQVSYLLADCLIRLAPVKADDALAAGRLEEQLKGAIELLDGFIGGQPNDPQAADALLKLGLCHQRLAGIQAQPADRAKSLTDARTAYEKLIGQFPKHAHQSQAIFERARCIALAGDKQGAINEMQRFLNDPLKAAAVAPMAVLQLSLLLREQRKAADAANVLAQCRQQHEGTLKNDPQRAAWIPVLQYQHGMALKEAGRLAEARSVFDNLAKQFSGKPEAVEAALRSSQCLQEEGLAKLEAARKVRVTARKPEETVAAERAFDEGLKLVQEAVRSLESQAEQLRQKQPAAEIRARMLYETAWGYRVLADAEVDSARGKIRQDLLKKKQEEISKKNPGAPPATIAMPEVALSTIPMQPAEQKLRTQFQTLIASFPDLPLANNARFELAEVLADRGEHDQAIKLLSESLDKEPPADLADKVRIRLGVSQSARKDMKLALAQFEAVAQNPKSLLAGEAVYRAGECLLAMEKPEDAVKRLVVFRDQQPFQNLPGISDRALLRLGHAYAGMKKWNESRQAHEILIGRFGNSPWIHEARYGIGWAWQNQQQYDNAVNTYMQVTAATATETAAKAQLQIGLCRLEQKRHSDAATALLVVPFTYDYPEWTAIALCEAARALIELKQSDHAEKLLKRVIRDHKDSKWGQIAKERLEILKGG